MICSTVYKALKKILFSIKFFFMWFLVEYFLKDKLFKNSGLKIWEGEPHLPPLPYGSQCCPVFYFIFKSGSPMSDIPLGFGSPATLRVTVMSSPTATFSRSFGLDTMMAGFTPLFSE